MTAAVIRALLVASPALTARVPATRILAGELPQNITLPALSIEEISSVPQPTIDAQAYALMRTRVQITISAANYPQQKSLVALVRTACEYQRGTIAGQIVSSITMESTGPDLRDSDAQIFQQPIDFLVVHQS